MKITLAAAVLGVFVLSAPLSAAPDPVAAAPQSFTERLGNDAVRVMEYSSRPGDKEPEHRHGRTVLYVLAGGKTRHTYPDGKTKDVEYKAGEVLWREPIVHSVENIGNTELRLLLVELKFDKPSGKP